MCPYRRPDNWHSLDWQDRNLLMVEFPTWTCLSIINSTCYIYIPRPRTEIDFEFDHISAIMCSSGMDLQQNIGMGAALSAVAAICVQSDVLPCASQHCACVLGEKRKSSTGGISPLVLWVSIGLVAAFSVVAVIIITVVCCRRRMADSDRKKRKWVSCFLLGYKHSQLCTDAQALPVFYWGEADFPNGTDIQALLLRSWSQEHFTGQKVTWFVNKSRSLVCDHSICLCETIPWSPDCASLYMLCVNPPAIWAHGCTSTCNMMMSWM